MTEEEELQATLTHAGFAGSGNGLPDASQVRRLGDRRRRLERARNAGLAVGVAAVAGGGVLAFPGGPSLPGVSSGPSQSVITYARIEPVGLTGMDTDIPLEMRAGCLVVGNSLVVWPQGTRWDESSRTVVFDPEGDAREIQVGETFPSGLGATSQPVSRMRGYLNEKAQTDVGVCLEDADVSQTDMLAVSYALP